MSNVPLLPGINAPMDEVSVKQQKLLERTEAKKQIMGEKAAGKQRAIRVDPFLAKEAQEESRKDYLGDASVVERAAYDSKAWIPVEDQDSQLGTAGQMAADVTEGTVNFGAFLGNVLGMGGYISNMEKVSNENIAAHQAEQMYAAQQKELYAADRQVTVDLLSGKIGQIEADVARANIAKAWDSLKAPNAQQSAALDQRPKQAEIGMNPAAALTMSPSDYAEGGVLEQAKTPRERIEGAKAMLGITNKAMAAVEDSVKGIANPVHTEKVTGDLGKSFNKHKPTFDVVRNAYEAGDKDFAIREGTKAVVNMAADMGLDIVENPRGVADFVAQNLPQIVVGAAGTGGKVLMSTSNLGYGLDTYRQGLNTFVEKNGRQPTQEESTEMLAFGMAAAALDQGVDANFVKTLKGASGDAIGEVIQRNTGSKVARLVSAPITGMAEELPTEAIQSVIEKDLSHLNYDIDAKNAVVGGVIGGAAGAALKGGLEPAGQIAEGAAAAQAKMVEQNNERRLQREKSRVSKEVLDAAIQTGDVSALTDPTSDHYSPVLAANALFERTKREDLSAEDKAKQAEQAQQVVLGLEKRIEELDANKNKARPEDLANITGNITRIQEALGKVDPAQNPELHGQLTETLKAYEEERTALDVVDPETLAMREKEIQSLEALLPDVRRMADAASASVASLSQPKPEDIAKDVELVNTPAAQAGEEHKAAAKRVITLAMEGEGISSDDIDALVGNLDNSLSAEERDFLGTVRDNRFAENNFKSREDVRMDVLDGSADGQFLGINQFRKRLSASIKAGNADQAATHLQGITAFAQERAGKVKTMLAAWKDFQRTGEKTQWVRDPSSPTGFVKADREYTREELTEAKGFEIHGRSARLIKSVQEEAALAAGALKEMQAAYGLAFNTKPAQATATQQKQPAKPVTQAKTTKPAPAPAPVTANDSSENGRLSGKRAAYQAAKESGAPDDVAANEVQRYQEKANDIGEPMNLWRSASGQRGLVPASRKSPFVNGGIVATFYPDNAGGSETGAQSAAQPAAQPEPEPPSKPTENTTPAAESTPAPATKAAAPSPKKMKLFSGGAKGSDSFWGKTAARFGIPQDQILHYYHGDKTPEGNTPLTEGQVAEGTVKAKQAAKALGRNWSSKAFVQNLLIRNWMQVKHADAVFAVGTFDPKNPTKLSGGTAYAVEMAIQHQVPVHFFEQEKGQWFTWDGAAWQETEVPTLTQNFAGIGTRDLNDAGKRAIEAVFEKTFGQAQAANTPEAEPQANAEGGVVPTSPAQADVANRTLEDALALTEDDYIKAVNPTGEVLSTELQMSGPYGVPLDNAPLELPEGSFKVSTKEGIDLYRTPEKTLAGWPEDFLYAVKGGNVLGFYGVRMGAVETYVTPAARSQGVGSLLATEYLRGNPFAPAQGMTPAGERNRRKAFRALQAEQKTAPEAEPSSDLDAELKEIFARINEEADVAESLEAAEEPASSLSVLEDTANPIHGQVIQRKVKEDQSGGNPLAEQPNFLSHWIQNPDVSPFLPKGLVLSAKQSRLLRTIKETMAEWVPALSNVLVPPDTSEKAKAFWYLDPIQFFQKEDGSVDQNFGMAMGLAGFDLLSDLVSNSGQATESWINKALGRDEEAPVSPQLSNLVSNAGVREGYLSREAGKQVLKMLNLRFTDDAPQDLQFRLEYSVGNNVVALLEHLGLLERTVITDDRLQREMNALGAGDPNRQHVFFRPSQANGEVREDIQELVKTLVGTEGFMDKFFGIESARVEPGFEAKPFTQKNAKGTDSPLPKDLIDRVNAHQQNAYQVRFDTFGILRGLADDIVLKMAGQEEVTVHTPEVMKEGIEGANKALARTWEADKQYLENLDANEGLDTPLFMEIFVARNHRMHYKNTVLNPQASKISRWLLGMEGWRVTIDTANEQLMENFKLRILEGFGVKTDKSVNRDTINREWTKRTHDPVIRRAVSLLASALAAQEEGQDFSFTPGEQQMLLDAVEKGGEKLHSFDSLLQLAHWQHAYNKAPVGEDGKKPASIKFSTVMAGEVDGKTNGGMLAMLGYATAGWDDLNRGGFIEKGSLYEHFSAWASKNGHLDLYESFTAYIAQAMADGFEDWQIKQLQSLFAITGELTAGESVTKAGREFSKKPMTTLFYGSGKESTLDGMFDAYIEKIYDHISKISENGESNGMQLKDLIGHLNVIIKAGNSRLKKKGVPLAPLLDPKMTIGEALKLDFMPQRAAMRQGYDLMVKKPLESSLDKKFGNHLATTGLMIEASNLIFDLYRSVYEAQRKRLVQKLIAQGARVNQKGEMIHDLTRAQERELREKMARFLPVIGLASSGAKNNPDFLMVKKERVSSTDSLSPDYKVEVRRRTTGANGQKKLSKHYAEAEHYKELPPGVSSLPIGTQSKDARISSTSMAQLPVFNMHDANYFGLGDIVEGARNLNQATFETLLDYSLPTQLADTLERILQAAADTLKSKHVDTDYKTDLVRALQALLDSRQEEGEDAEIVTFSSFASMAIQLRGIEVKKLIKMAELKVVEQYPLEGAGYRITDEDQERVITRLNEARARDLTPLEKAAAQLDKYLDRDSGEAKELLPKEGRPVEGAPYTQSNPALVELLEKGTTAQGLMEFLEEHYQAAANTSKINQFNLKLIKMIRRVVPGDLPIHYITPNTETLHTDRDMSRDLAWFHQDSEGNASISVWGQDYATSNIQPQVLLHELLHAALVHVVDAAATPEVRELVAELEELRAKAAAFIKSVPNLHKHAPGVKNIHEFLAYGLTSPQFQQQVLVPLELESKTTGNLLRTAWHKFVDIMSGLLLGNSIARTRAHNGLSTFLANSLPLFQAAHELQQKAVESGPVTLAHAGIQEAMEMTTEQVFRGLPASPNRALSDQFQAHLSSLLNGIVSNLHGPFGSFAQRLRKEQAVSMSDVMLKSMATGQMPFASEALAGPFLVTEQEAFVLEQVEVTVHAALTSPGNFHSMAYTQLERLFEQARKKITAAQLHDGDWATATQAERDLAQKRWNFLFDVSATANNKNRFLSRFAAMALAHEPTRKLMAFDTDSSKEAVEGTWLEKLVHWFRNLLTALGNQLNHTYDGQRADARLEALVDRLVDIEAKRRRRIASPANRAMEFVESLGDSTSNKLRDAIRRAGDSDLLKNSKSAYLRAAGTTLGAWAGDRFADIAEVGLRVRDQQLQKPLGVAANLVTQLRGATDKTREFYRLLGESKHHEAQRQNKIENTRDTVLKNFLNQGADLTPEQKKAISQLLRLDLASLLDQYSETQIAQLLSDPAALNAAIQQERQQLAGAKFAQAYDVQAKDLGYFMVSGITHAENQVLNAQGIVLMLATDQKKEVEAGALTKYQGVVDRLATLYALQYSSPITLAEASSVWRSEQDNKKGNGLVSTLKVYRTLINQAKDTVFQKAEPLMIKGYLPEIHDPHREVLGALPEEEEALRRQGYTPGEILETDSLDPNPQRRRLYVHTNRGLRPFLSAVMSYTSKAAKGSERKRFGSEVDKTVIQGSRQELLAMRRAKVQAARAQLAQRSSSYDPRKSRDRSTKAVPVFNAKGEVANYRYMMTQENRDILLDRDNRFENLLGQLAGNTFDKFVAPQNNKIVVEALHAHFQEEYGNKPDSFALIAGNSKDPALREIWRMLPDETKKDIQKTWGFAGMQVPYEMLDLIFGYRKPSISQVFDKNPEEWSTLQQMVIPMLETVYPRIGNHLRVAENVWQEAVGLVKNIWVIRSIVTILGNLKSNISIMYAYGISPADMVRNCLVAFRGAWAYRRDFKEREQLQLVLDSGLVMGSTDEIKRQIAQLSNRLATNPVRELIEAGLLPTIVEDVQTTTDEYSYQSKLEKKVSGALKYIPPMAVTVGKELLMTKDTQSYGMFNQLVQMSDFMGRYTLYQHLITQKKNPLSKQEAMDTAMDVFIQYDIPLHRNLQYLDEMGIIPFMRFHLRIQKVIFRLFREKPARMLSLVLLSKFMGISSLITDASLFNNLGNPLDVGALNLPGAIDDITTMKMALEFLPGE